MAGVFIERSFSLRIPTDQPPAITRQCSKVNDNRSDVLLEAQQVTKFFGTDDAKWVLRGVHSSEVRRVGSDYGAINARALF